MPQQTLEAVKDHAQVGLTIENDLDQARFQLANFEMLGLSLDKATAELEEEGVVAFSKAIHDLFATIEERSQALVA